MSGSIPAYLALLALAVAGGGFPLTEWLLAHKHETAGNIALVIVLVAFLYAVGFAVTHLAAPS